MLNPADILKQYWGYESFREPQEEIIQSVMNDQPTLALLPTGGGKSICFQVPALCLEGICIVVSPLIALMQDQVDQLQKRGVKAVAIYSGMTLKEIDIALDNCIYGGVKLLYVSPERLKTEMFIARAEQMNISLLAIDEAHCISQWGYDFRPPYLEIKEFIDQLQIKKIIALTASATRQVKFDMLEKLGIPEARIFQKTFARPNLSYSVFELEHKERKLLEILQNVPGSSVVYVRSRKQTKAISDFLRGNGISAEFYHAGLPGHVRAGRQEQWISGDVRVMVSTNAFGMGIDKPNVRSVIHYDLADSLEAYYQEAGRAGRDEKKAFAVQLYSKADLDRVFQRIEQSMVSVELIKRTYQALANYYKLAVGSSSLSSFEFDYDAFINRFNLPKVETYHAINKLSEEGLVELNEAFRQRSKAMIIISQQELYSFQVANKNLDVIIKILLRLYGGELFVDLLTISEKDISKLMGVSLKTVHNQLEYLQNAEVIVYHHPSEHPRLTFLTPRMDATNLDIDQVKIEWRREVALEKVNKIKEYVQSEFICRTRLIQNYFDEETYEDCGVCDICLSRKKKQKELPLDDLERFIAESPRTESDLNTRFSGIDQEKLIYGLRTLMDQRRISLTTDEKFTCMK